jgi:hypothetical protein
MINWSRLQFSILFELLENSEVIVSQFQPMIIVSAMLYNAKIAAI